MVKTTIDRDAVLQVGAVLFAARPEHAQTQKGLELLADAAVNIVLAIEAAIPRREESIAEDARALKAKMANEKAIAAEHEAHEIAFEAARKRAEKAMAHLDAVKAAAPVRARLRAVS